MNFDIKMISKSALFKHIDQKDLQTLLKCLNVYQKSYQKKETILLENNRINYIGLIISGSVTMVKEARNGEQSLIMTLSPGEIFGETFVCHDDPYSQVSFTADKKAEILFLPFYRILHQCQMSCPFHHRLIENMVTIISNKNMMFIRKIEILSKRTLQEKILTYLEIEGHHRYDVAIEVPLNRKEMAEYLCVDRSALSRELSKMQKKGLIFYLHNTFILKSLSKHEDDDIMEAK